MSTSTSADAPWKSPTSREAVRGEGDEPFPFRSVIVGSDGAEGGRDALALALALAAGDARLTLVHVNTDDGIDALAALVAETSDGVLPERTVASAAARMRAGGWGSRVAAKSVGAVSVAHGLTDAARAVGADLIVVGSSRRGGLARLLLGDDARAVVRRAPCAVAVAPRGLADAPPPRFVRIGVGYGPDPASERALAVARALSSGPGAVAVVHVEQVPSRHLALDAVGLYSVEDRRAAIAAGERVLRPVSEVDERRVEIGRVHDGLLHLGESVDLLVVGVHHRSPIGRLLHGSVPEELLEELSCPLIAVPEPS